VIADKFIEHGFPGQIHLSASSTNKGLKRFCEKGDIDIVDSVRLLNQDELATCQRFNRQPIALPIAQDNITLVVSSQNTFVPDSLNKAQIRKIFTAEKWSDVDPKWPNQIIKRILPSKVSSNLGIAEVSRYFYLENEGNLLTNLPNTSFYDFAEQLHAKTLLEPYMFGVLEQITYRKNTDIYKSIAIDGVKSSQPNYPLTRVFYIYADAN
jgi:phosphate transport system substrate-binding protein